MFLFFFPKAVHSESQKQKVFFYNLLSPFVQRYSSQASGILPGEVVIRLWSPSYPFSTDSIFDGELKPNVFINSCIQKKMFLVSGHDD